MYKFVGFESEAITVLKQDTTEYGAHFSPPAVPIYIKSQTIAQVCNPYQRIHAGKEGNTNSNYSLHGVLILIRHGDRGPLTHVRNISSINCVGSHDPLYASYETYIDNITGTPTISQILSSTFHGIPPLPSTECSLGLLTKTGASQLLTIGKILNEVYYEQLKLNASTIHDEVKAYSTRYRRTLQSALAFLFTFLGKNNFPRVILQEAPSLSFCFEDCACPSADIYQKNFNLEIGKLIKLHPAVLRLVRAISSIVYESPDRKISSDPHSLKDALLTYVCHDANLPCSEFYPSPDACVRFEHVSNLFSYLDTEYKQFARSNNLKKLCLLRAYGLLKNIVSHLLQIVSEKKPKLVLYSGHDKTITYLAMALGVTTNRVTSPHYASRLIFEVYKSQDHGELSHLGPVGSDYFFRLLFNGVDLTKEVKFCKNMDNMWTSNVTNESYRKRVFYLCPIESIIRFLHEDYFSPFNATNIKDACSITV